MRVLKIKRVYVAVDMMTEFFFLFSNKILEGGEKFFSLFRQALKHNTLGTNRDSNSKFDIFRKRRFIKFRNSINCTTQRKKRSFSVLPEKLVVLLSRQLEGESQGPRMKDYSPPSRIASDTIFFLQKPLLWKNWRTH